MLQRQPPDILLYGFGLALLLSLGFNGFLLLNPPCPAHTQATPYTGQEDVVNYQSLLQACNRNNHKKDSLIHALEHLAQTPLTPTRQETAQ